MQITFTTSNVAENWRRFERQFRVYYAACELQLKARATQVGILLHTAGAEAQDVHETFDYAVGEDGDDFELVLTKFRTYCEPRKNIVFERYQFWGRNQNEGEPIDQLGYRPSHKSSKVRISSSRERNDPRQNCLWRA